MPWFVIYIKPKYDKIITEALEKKGVVHYCPYYESIRQWSDRRKKIYVPLFSSYMFVRLEDYSEEKMKILTVPGVSKFLWFDNKPCIIKSEEINEIKNFLLNYRGIKPEIHLLPGQMATINKGVFSNHSGQVKFTQGNKAYLMLTSLGCYFTAVVPVNVLEIANDQFGEVVK
jgi:transcription antitermination factor NusG